jgi:hypothetical protein
MSLINGVAQQIFSSAANVSNVPIQRVLDFAAESSSAGGSAPSSPRCESGKEAAAAGKDDDGDQENDGDAEKAKQASIGDGAQDQDQGSANALPTTSDTTAEETSKSVGGDGEDKKPPETAAATTTQQNVDTRDAGQPQQTNVRERKPVPTKKAECDGCIKLKIPALKSLESSVRAANPGALHRVCDGCFNRLSAGCRKRFLRKLTEHQVDPYPEGPRTGRAESDATGSFTGQRIDRSMSFRSGSNFFPPEYDRGSLLRKLDENMRGMSFTTTGAGDNADRPTDEEDATQDVKLSPEIALVYPKSNEPEDAREKDITEDKVVQSPAASTTAEESTSKETQHSDLSVAGELVASRITKNALDDAALLPECSSDGI